MIARVNLVLVIWFLLKNFVGRKMALSTLVLSMSNDTMDNLRLVLTSLAEA